MSVYSETRDIWIQMQLNLGEKKLKFWMQGIKTKNTSTTSMKLTTRLKAQESLWLTHELIKKQDNKSS